MARWGELKCHDCADLQEKLRKSALQELSALGQASEAYQAQLAAEAKLAKAVEGLREAENTPEPDHHVPQFRHVMDVIGATLAEITGGKDA